MSSEENDLTAKEILDFLLILPLLWVFMFIGVLFVIAGKVLDLVRRND